MCVLAELQNWPGAGVPFFSHAEEMKIMNYPFPKEVRRKFTSGATYYPRRPVEVPATWFANHALKLRSLEQAAGVAPSLGGM